MNWLTSTPLIVAHLGLHSYYRQQSIQTARLCVKSKGITEIL